MKLRTEDNYSVSSSVIIVAFVVVSMGLLVFPQVKKGFQISSEYVFLSIFALFATGVLMLLRMIYGELRRGNDMREEELAFQKVGQCVDKDE